MGNLYSLRDVDFQHVDNRGGLTQLIHSGFAQVNVLESKAGSSRGGHFHKRSVEAFYLISGSVEVEFIDKNQSEKRIFYKNEFFEVKPYVLHSMHFLEDCIMVQMYDVPIQRSDGTKDIFAIEEFYE